MSIVKILPPFETWDSDNTHLYYHILTQGEDGLIEAETIRVPHPQAQEFFFRRRKIPVSALNNPQYNECKFCGKQLIDGHWRRMHMCRICHQEQRGMGKMFYDNCTICNKKLTKNDLQVSKMCSKCYER